MQDLKNSKLVTLLKTFSRKELKEFESYVTFYLSGKGKNSSSLIKILISAIVKGDASKLAGEKIYKRLYPGKKYSEQTMKNLLTGITKLCEEYLISTYINRNPFLMKTFLLEELINRRVDNIFKREMKMAKADFNKSLIDESYYQDKYRLEILERSNDINMNRQQNNFENTVNMSNYTVRHFIIAMSGLVSGMKANSFYFNFDFSDSEAIEFLKHFNIKEWISSFQKRKDSESEIIEMFMCKLQISLENNDEAFKRLLFLVNKNYGSISHGTLYNLYMSLTGYCGRRHMEDPQYSRIAFGIFKDMLEKNVYSYRKNYMTIIIFRYIFLNALRVKDTGWAEYFVNNYVNKVSPEHRDNMYHYSMAKLFFEAKRFEESINEISKVQYELFTFKFDLRALTLQNYFELTYFEEALNLIDSHKHFLSKNKKVSEFFKTTNLNFVNFLKELILTRLNYKKENVRELNKKIENSESVFSKEWLLQKVKELN